LGGRCEGQHLKPFFSWRPEQRRSCIASSYFFPKERLSHTLKVFIFPSSSVALLAALPHALATPLPTPPCPPLLPVNETDELLSATSFDRRKDAPYNAF